MDGGTDVIFFTFPLAYRATISSYRARGTQLQPNNGEIMIIRTASLTFTHLLANTSCEKRPTTSEFYYEDLEPLGLTTLREAPLYYHALQVVIEQLSEPLDEFHSLPGRPTHVREHSLTICD